MKVIHLQMVNPEAFRMVLKYLYTKDLNIVDPDSLAELLLDTLALAHQYVVEPLKSKLEFLISEQITVENVCSLLVFAHTYQLDKVIPILFHSAFSDIKNFNHSPHQLQLKRDCCEYFVKHSGEVQQYAQSSLIEHIVNGFTSSV